MILMTEEIVEEFGVLIFVGILFTVALSVVFISHQVMLQYRLNQV